jgi:hypothetical protein
MLWEIGESRRQPRLVAYLMDNPPIRLGAA